MVWTAEAVMQALYTLVAVMLVVVLYHVIFIVVDLRKTMRRMNSMTEQVETVLMKPLSLTEKALEWLVQYIEGMTHKKHAHHKHHAHTVHAKEEEESAES